MQRYSVTPQPIETLLPWVRIGEIAIPEIQRPFVWDATKVRNLLDSLWSRRSVIDFQHFSASESRFVDRSSVQSAAPEPVAQDTHRAKMLRIDR